MKISAVSSAYSFVRLFGVCGRRAFSHVRLLSTSCCALAALSFQAVPALQGQTAHFAGAETTIVGGLNDPRGTAVDGSGDVYIADTNNHRVLKETASGDGYTQSTVVDRAGNGQTNPDGVAVDGSGNVYIADGNANRVLKETPSGSGYIQSTVANQENNGLTSLHGVAVDGSGNVYIADGNTNRVLKETLSGGGYIQSTVADQANNGLTNPHGVAVDGSGNIYIADTNNSRLLKETLTGGTYTQTAIGSSLNFPYGVAVDGGGNVYVADSFNDRVLKETLSEGTYTQTTVGSGLSFPTSVAVDGKRNVYIVDTNDNRVLEVAAAVNFNSVNIASSSSSTSLTFTFDTAGSLGAAPKVLTAGAPKLDFTDAGTGTCTTNGASHAYAAGDSCTVNVVFTPKFAGPRYGAVVLAGADGAAIATAYVYGNGIGPQVGFLPATQITVGSGFDFPDGVAVDGGGNVYVGDTGHNAVKEIPSGCPAGYCITTRGGGFNHPSSLAVDGAGNVYVADFQAVKKFPPGCSSASCVTPLSAFPSPTNLAVDGSGNVYVSDSGFRAVKEIPPGCASSSCVTTRADNLEGLGGVAIDGRGNIYVNNFDNNLVLELSPSCTSSSCAKSLGGGFKNPTAVAVDASGNVYVLDFGNSAIKKIPLGCTAAKCVVTLTQDSSTFYFDLKVDSRGDIYAVDMYNSRVVEEAVVRSPFLTFADTPLYSTSSDSPKTVTLENIGTAPLLFLETGSRNPDVPPDFSLVASSTCPQVAPFSDPAALPSGRSCTLLWSFTPTILGGPPTEIASITDNNLNGLPSIQTINLNGTVTQATQTIIFRPIPSQTVGHSVTLVPSASSGLPVSLQSLSPSVCTVSGEKATAIAIGTCTIQATQAGNDVYAPAAPISQSFTVTQAGRAG